MHEIVESSIIHLLSLVCDNLIDESDIWRLHSLLSQNVKILSLEFLKVSKDLAYIVTFRKRFIRFSAQQFLLIYQAFSKKTQRGKV